MVVIAEWSRSAAWLARLPVKKKVAGSNPVGSALRFLYFKVKLYNYNLMNNTEPEIHNQVICANVFIRKGGKYLVLKRSPYKKYAPNVVHPIGGKVELGENPYQAAIREAFEEAGIKIKNLKLEACSLEMHPQDDSLTDWLIFNFSADYDSGNIGTTEEGKLMLLSAEEFKVCKLFPPMRKIINYILEPNNGTVFASCDLGKDMEVIKEKISICIV